MFGLQPLKLKELVFTGSTMDLSPLLKEPAFDVESLEIDVGTGSFAREFIDADYAVHFQKTSLKKVRLVDFWFIDRAIICEAAEQSGFLLDEKLAELAPIYEFTRKQWFLQAVTIKHFDLAMNLQESNDFRIHKHFNQDLNFTI